MTISVNNAYANFLVFGATNIKSCVYIGNSSYTNPIYNSANERGYDLDFVINTNTKRITWNKVSSDERICVIIFGDFCKLVQLQNVSSKQKSTRCCRVLFLFRFLVFKQVCVQCAVRLVRAVSVTSRRMDGKDVVAFRIGDVFLHGGQADVS